MKTAVIKGNAYIYSSKNYSLQNSFPFLIKHNLYISYMTGKK